MVEDLIKRLSNASIIPTVDECLKAADLIEQQAARLTALKSERDALLAAAGKEAVAKLVKCRDMKGSQWFDIKVFDKTLEHGTKLYTAPTAALEKGDGRDAWQPIDTAPKDGTEVLLIATRHSMLIPHPEMIVGAYRQGWWSGPSTLSHVTLWQPLPAPPAALSQQKANHPAPEADRG